MPSKKDVWYYCKNCNLYSQDLERLRECQNFQHMIKRKKPLHLRIVHQASEDISEFVTVTVDDDNWDVLLRLAVFKTDEKGRTYHLTNIILNMPLTNVVKQLNSMFPDIKLTKVKLIKLLKDAIVKGVYSEVSETSVKVLLTLDSWLLLEPRNICSKLVFTSHAKIDKLIKKIPKTTVYAKPIR